MQSLIIKRSACSVQFSGPCERPADTDHRETPRGKEFQRQGTTTEKAFSLDPTNWAPLLPTLGLLEGSLQKTFLVVTQMAVQLRWSLVFYSVALAV